jgi:hypothetical protein
MYPNHDVYLVEYDSVKNQIYFWKEEDPSKGVDSTLTYVTSVPPDARFFVLEFLDPNVSDAFKTWAPDVASTSILNKAYEIARTILVIRTITGARAVNILAHSMGGLDARAYVENLASQGACYDGNSNPDYSGNTCSPGGASASYAGDVANIVTLDTPHAGSQLANAWPNQFLSLVGYTCQAATTTNSQEISPGSALLNGLNYTGSTIAGKSPISLTVPLQAIQNYISDDAQSWTGLTEVSDDIVGKSSQSITNHVPTEDASARLVDIEVPYLKADILADSSCTVWVPVAGTEPLLHFTDCLASLQPTQRIVGDQLINDTVPWVSSWSVTPNTLSLGGTVTIQYTATDLSSSTLSRAELWRASDANSQPGTWAEVDSPQTLSGNSPTQVTFSDPPTAAGKYWYGTHLFDSGGNEATEPSPAQVTVGAAAQAPTVTVQASPAQVTQGSNVNLSATVQSSIATPTGTVTFYDGSSALSPAIALNSVGAAAYSTSVLSLGSHSISVRYSGSSSFSPSTSTPITVTVKGANPQISVLPQNGTIGVTPFTKSGTGFTPNGPITHTATWPDNTKSIVNNLFQQNWNVLSDRHGQYNRAIKQYGLLDSFSGCGK